MAESENNTALLPKPGSKRLVWRYFGLRKAENGKPIDDGGAVCKTCHGRVVAKNDNTSNLLAHLKKNP